MDATANRSRFVDGKKMSLADLGYISVGLDDAWQACGTGVNGSFHDAEGNPLVDTKKFPSMKNMTDYGHSLGLKIGWCVFAFLQFVFWVVHYARISSLQVHEQL